MKIYLAASFSLKEEVRSLYQLFQAHGHEITKDWTHHEDTQAHERDEKRDLMERYALEDLEGVRQADVLIMLSDGPGGTGRYIELGAAIQSHLETQKPLVYVVGQSNADSIFYYHPSVIKKVTVGEVLEELKTLAA